MSSDIKLGTPAQALAVSPTLAMGERCGAMAAKRKIWVDLDNSPHVPFFVPIIEELQKRNYSILVTARDCFQVRELADLFQLDYKLIGRHSGKSKIHKVAGLCVRALQLIPTVLKEKPDLAVSHCSRSQLIASVCLGIPSLQMGDYEFATGSAFIHPTWHMCPEVIPNSALPSNCDRTVKYPGIKEDVYVSRFVPKPGIRQQLGLREEDVVVTIRPPANEAHYHSPKTDELFELAVEFLSMKADLKLVVLPRNEKQAISLRKRWPELFSMGKMRIPEEIVDGLNLIWHSDLVISAGGTMNREAAALDVPVYSVFRGEIGAVDRYLTKAGRLILIESFEDLRAKILPVRRERPAKPLIRRTAALSYIVERIASIAESQHPFSDQMEVTAESKSNGEARSQDATV